MQLNRRVALNGIWLDELDYRIVISGVEPSDGKENISAVDAAAGFGQRITSNRRSTLDIVVRFRLLERGRTPEGMQARAELLEKVNTWAAGGGWLTVNYKPDRRLRVILAQAPGEGGMWDFSKEFTLTFRAYGIPYWEKETPVSQTTAGNYMSGSGVLSVEGSAKTQANVELRNMSGMNVASASMTIAGKTMTFSGLGLGANETLVVDHSDDGLVRIRIRTAGGSYRSAMALRSADSADDYVISPGQSSFSYTSQRSCRMTVSWRARFL